MQSTATKGIQVFQIQTQSKSYIAKYNVKTKPNHVIKNSATVIPLSPCGVVITSYITLKPVAATEE